MKLWAALFISLALLIGAGEAQAAHNNAHVVLARAAGDLDRASNAPSAERQVLISTVISAVEAESSIGISDWLLAPLREPTPDLNQGKARIAASLDLMATDTGGEDLSARRASLDTVLQTPPFQTRDVKSFMPEWLLPLILLLEWLARNIWNLIRWPFDRLGELLQAFFDSPGFSVIVSLMAVAAVASLILLYRRGLRAALVSETELSAALTPLPLTSAQSLDRAQRLASDGRYRDASHFILLSALLWIEEHGQTRFEQSATNWEHLQRLDRQSPAARPLRGLIDRFDRLFYGQADTSAEEYRDLEELALRVRQAMA